MKRTSILSLLLVSLVFVVSGCGGDSETKSGGGGKADIAAGKKLFKSSCGSCHAMADAKTSGTFGPDLDTLRPSADEVVAQIERGGGGMPANLVKGAEAEDVAAYVEAKAGK